MTSAPSVSVQIDLDVLLKAWRLMCYAQELAETFDSHRELFKYVHSTSRGHEAIQLAAALQLLPTDYVYPYYRDESILLGIGMTPYEMFLQNLAKRDDPFSGGRHYYGHPSLRREHQTQVPYQSSSTGMQAIPATGAAQGLKYREKMGLIPDDYRQPPVVVCSLGDGSMTEGEVAEALQMAVLHAVPIIYLVQDNNWSISAYADEIYAMEAYEYAQGFKGLEVVRVDGSDFIASYNVLHRVLQTVRSERRPFLIHAKVGLIGHHTSGVRREWYRPEAELEASRAKDPFVLFGQELLRMGLTEEVLREIEADARETVRQDFERAKAAPEPNDIHSYYYAPTPITEERGTREPAGGKKIVMVDAVLHAMDDLLRQHPEALLYGQDVGGRLGGVFREAATLADKYGRERVFNTPIQEAYIVGSTAGMSAVGLKPIVEIQFADYIWPGLNQLFTELSRSYYLSYGKWPIQSLIRVPIGAYGSGGPFHSSSVESVLLNIHGIKVVYPSNAADLKGLLKAAFYDPNPVVMLEHKGLYWSKVPGTKEAQTIEPDDQYIIPLGKARTFLHADPARIESGESCAVVTYGMGVHWALNAARQFLPGQIEILDLRTLEPLDWPMIEDIVRRHGKVLVLTEENPVNSFAEALTGRIARRCFRYLDAPPELLGSENTPCIPLNSTLEQMVLPSAEKVARVLERLIND